MLHNSRRLMSYLITRNWPPYMWHKTNANHLSFTEIFCHSYQNLADHCFPLSQTEWWTVVTLASIRNDTQYLRQYCCWCQCWDWRCGCGDVLPPWKQMYHWHTITIYLSGSHDRFMNVMQIKSCGLLIWNLHFTCIFWNLWTISEVLDIATKDM